MLLRILSICSAFTCLCKGLDYVSSTGAQGFEELLDVVEKIGDLGKGCAESATRWKVLPEGRLQT